MNGQVFTVAKLHYINGVVYFVGQKGKTDLETLAEHASETTKSGNVKHPRVRVRTLVRFAQGLGLVGCPSKTAVEITQLGRKYYEAGDQDKWSLSKLQRKILRDHILSNPSRTPTIHSITSLYSLVEKGYNGSALAHEYAITIGKQDAWRSDVTYEGFTNFGLNYLRELGLIEGNHTLPLTRTDGNYKTHQMSTKKTFLFTWNPKNWKWNDLPQAVYEANAEGKYLDQWSCSATRQIKAGDRVFLMRLGVPPKGIMGSGIVVSEPFQDSHWDPKRANRGDTVYYVEIVFDVLSDLPIVTEQELASGNLQEFNWFPQSSGTTIPERVALALENLWAKATGISFVPSDDEDIVRIRIEGTKRSRLVTTYERNPKAREECLKHNGTTCYVCGISFEERYGAIGKGFIHVHHLVPVSDIQKEYEVDPVADLCPVCPNCHAMIHKRTPPYSIIEVKEMMKASHKVVGDK